MKITVTFKKHKNQIRPNSGFLFHWWPFSFGDTNKACRPVGHHPAHRPRKLDDNYHWLPSWSVPRSACTSPPSSTCLCAHDCNTVPVGSAPQPDTEGGGAPSSLSCPGPGLPPGTTLTCLEDLVAQGEAGTLPGVVGGELDEEHGARGDDGGRSDVPTVLPQEVCRLTVPIPDLDEVIPR